MILASAEILGGHWRVLKNRDIFQPTKKSDFSLTN